jgi:dATP/dGTP diphosphohydrolase, N-terminal
MSFEGERMKEYERDEKEEKEIKKAQEEGYGTKFDEGKERYDLVPPWALNELIKVYTYGTIKYDDNNWWKGMVWGKLFAALMRHAWKWWRGEKVDDESGLHHLAHVAWQCFALMEYERSNIGKDDRVPQAMDLKEELIETEECPLCGYLSVVIKETGKEDRIECGNMYCPSRRTTYDK